METMNGTFVPTKVGDVVGGVMADDVAHYIVVKMQDGSTHVVELTWEQRAMLGLLHADEIMRQDG